MFYCLQISYDKDNMYLVELCVRDEWFTCTKKSDMMNLFRLLRAVSAKRGQRVIPLMEKWCPEIGLFLISRGIGMLDKVKDVPLDLWPEICKALLENRNYPSSSMKLILADRPYATLSLAS